MQQLETIFGEGCHVTIDHDTEGYFGLFWQIVQAPSGWERLRLRYSDQRRWDDVGSAEDAMIKSVTNIAQVLAAQ